MDKYEENIGKNIREVRLERGLSQEKLADLCGFSNTILSAYENNRKTPNLSTISKIAKQLNVSIERLYYGDENSAFINSEPDEGKKIVNSIYYLWEMGIVSFYENYFPGYEYRTDKSVKPIGVYLRLNKHDNPIKRFINSLNEFKMKRDTYPNPDQYLDMLKESVASEINNEIKRMS